MVQTVRTKQEVDANATGVDSPYVRGLKRQARRMTKAKSIAHSFALEQIAKHEGYASWHDLCKKNPPVKSRRSDRPDPYQLDRSYRAAASEPKKIPVAYKRRKQLAPVDKRPSSELIVDLRQVSGRLSLPRNPGPDVDLQDDANFAAGMPFHGSRD